MLNMEEVTEAGIKMLFDEELFLVNPKTPETEEINAQQSVNQKVENDNEQSLLEVKNKETLQVKGGNQKGILVLVTNPEEEFLNASDETLLLNILKAIGCTLQDVAIINHSKAAAGWQNSLNFTKAIVFGVTPQALGLPVEPYLPAHYNKVTWLVSDALNVLAQDKALKAKLWKQLQQMFKK